MNKKICMLNFNRLFFLSIIASSVILGCAEKGEQSTANPWQQAEQIKAAITVPEFPDTTFNIADYGAVEGGETKNTEAFRKAIAAAHEAGGGKVLVPEGTFLTGAIHLQSNVNLHLAEGATILFSRDPADYLPVVFTRWEGMELMNYSPFIYANGEENIAITGNGTLDGNATLEHWWPWKGDKEDGWEEGMPNQDADRDSLHQMNADQVPPEERIFGEGHYLRPNFVQFYNSKNILVSGVTLVRSPMWNIHPVLSENITIDGIRIETLGPNNDGIDPESSKNVLITNTYFDTGDDCIAIKSGRNQDGRRIGVPSENIVIENSVMKDGHGGIVMGSEISGGVRNVFARNLQMDSPNLDRVLRIKTSSRRGGTTENIYLKDIEVGQYKEAAIRANMFYEPPGDFMPTIRNIVVENLQVEDGGEYGILIEAYEESPVANLKVINSSINGVETPTKINHAIGLHFENFQINGTAVTP
ncbi:glycoside hydrolase family 28 protein [Aliifodinibius sp. S!AR15-10]|uniref:glycoside hydrolase family 28 protein n=1 Tax=Aliifodinibius sp. S!AR15-10 TaxID=2950437 RepID=UPI00285AC1FC|nr:glycoside hydrolase family 28 protein [Aliifodinibius sp. S!AR15-10]MDR8393342.1 glycoside hydrolase family 28 protein [Aliifodinibius sp. S!AR15-10]